MRTTERERAAFVLGIEYAADNLKALADEDIANFSIRRSPHKKLLLEFAKTLLLRLNVSGATANTVDLDLQGDRRENV